MLKQFGIFFTLLMKELRKFQGYDDNYQNILMKDDGTIAEFNDIFIDIADESTTRGVEMSNEKLVRKHSNRLLPVLT